MVCTKADAQTSQWHFPFKGPVTLDSLTHYMNAHTDIRLTFNSGKIKGDKLVLFSAQLFSLQDFLMQIRRQTGLSWSFYGKHIIFRDLPVPRKKKMPDTRPSRPSRHPAELPLRPVKLSVAKISVVGGGEVKMDPGKKPIQVSPARERDPASSTWFIRASGFVNEVFYTNVGLEGGIRPLYLQFSVGSNFHIRSWHIGIGAGNFKLWNLPTSVIAGYSPLSTSIGIDSGLQRVNFEVKGQLYDLGLITRMPIGNHWSLAASVEGRWLKTSYYKEGVLTSPGHYFKDQENPEKTLYLVRPPFLITNNFDRARATNVKTWLGISLGVYYTF